MKFAKCLRTPIFTRQLQWLLIRFNLCFQRSPGQKPMQLCPVNTRFSWKKNLLPWKSRSSHRTCSVKVGLQLDWKKGSSIAKFLRTPILKNICEQLILEIGTSVTNLPKFFYPFNIPNFAMAEWFFHVTYFAKVSLLLLKKL